jgi:hypothetical protein
MLPEANEAFLHHVLGLVPVAQHARGHAIESAAVSIDQNGERLDRTFAHRAHEAGIVLPRTIFPNF